MKYIQQWFRRLIVIVLWMPAFYLDFMLFVITLGILDRLTNLDTIEKLYKLWR